MDLITAVLNNLKGKSKDELKCIIDDAVQSKDESTIPGLGVILRSSWEKISDSEKDSMLNYLEKGIR